jgi:hypothetical protein
MAIIEMYPDQLRRRGVDPRQLAACALVVGADGSATLDTASDCYRELFSPSAVGDIAATMRVPMRANRPAIPTPTQLANAARAKLTGRKVSLDVIEQRTAICRACDRARIDDAGKLWCSVCGCGVSGENREVMNLAAYEENLPRWGCKHPERAAGKGWPTADGVKSTN